MPNSFKYTDVEMKVLKNFANINPNIIILPDKFSVINGTRQSVIGYYNFEKSKDHEIYGIFDCTEFISLISQMSEYELDVKERYISIIDKSNNAKLKYNLTSLKMLPEVQDLSDNFEELDTTLKFSLTAEKLNIMKKVAVSISAERIFIESFDDRLRIIAAGKSIEKSTNPFEIMLVKNEVQENNLDKLIYINHEELKVLEGDYVVEIKMKEKKGISHWKNLLYNVDYYIGVSIFREE